jgi:hypothetical protein
MRKINRSAQIRVLHDRYPELGASALARRVGVSRQAARSVLTRFLSDTTEDELRQFQESKADIYDAVQQRCLGSVTSKKLSTASVGTLVTAAAILQDKSQILRGLPTGMDVHVLLDIAALVRGDRGSVRGSTVTDDRGETTPDNVSKL